MIVTCPNCGAPTEFRYDDSLVRVCKSCNAAVLRTDRGIETLGRLADITPIESPLRLFADGFYKGVSFILVGMAQIKHPAGGIWQEWYAKLDGGQWGWLSEAQGRFYMTLERVGVQLPRYEELRPGLSIAIGDTFFTIGEVGTATFASATGEIPYRLDPTATFRFADLSDGRGGFATIDYNDGSEEPTLYVGHQVGLADLRISGGELPYAGGPAPATGATLKCPNCGGSLELVAPDQTLHVGCPYCNHLISVETGNLRVITKLKIKAIPKIPLGSVGKLADGEMTVIGYMQRSAFVDGTWYPFEEYLLFAPAVGFRWLVCSDGHWSYVQPVAPGAVELMPVRYGGVKFELFQIADLRVDVVLGEFYWKVQENERVVAEDHIAPPAMLSVETSKTEQSWSLSTYLPAGAVERAFPALAGIKLLKPMGVGANQPYGLHGAGLAALVLVLAMFTLGMIRLATASNATKYTEQMALPPGAGTPLPPTPGEPAEAPAPGDPPPEAPGHVQFTKPFQLEGGKNVEIFLDCPLANQWAYVAVDLVNEATGAVVSFDANLESYSGVDGGESWSEGDSDASQVLGPPESGTYIVRVEGSHGQPSALPLTLVVKQDVFRARWWLIASGILAIPFLLIWWHANAFNKKRWENSQLARSGSGADYDDDDDDD